MDRRMFLEGVAAATVLVAGGEVSIAFGGTEAEVPDGQAFEPWRTWRAPSRGPLSLVRAAILASNAFNSQPWLFRVSEARIDVLADLHRNLGAFDPYFRELYLSVGCALENLMLGAAAGGYHGALTLAPPGRAGLAARVDLSTGTPGASDLYDAIPHRHTNRHPFDAARPVGPALVAELAAQAHGEPDVNVILFTDEAQRKATVDLVVGASEELFKDPAVPRGTAPWIRTSARELARRRDGVLVEPDEANAPMSYADLMSTGRVFGVISVRDRTDRAQTLRAGRVWQRLHLLATARGLAARPANGAVELVDVERHHRRAPRTAARLAELVGTREWQPTFMFYMGHPTLPAGASARRRVEDVIR